MEFNTDGTYKSYGFRDGSPFNPMPYVQDTDRAGLTDRDMRDSLLAELLVMERFGLSAEQAANWLDTGDPDVGWDFSQVATYDAEVFDIGNSESWQEECRGILDELLGYGEGA